MDWSEDARDCPVCGARPAWHETDKGYRIHCSDAQCPLYEGVEGETIGDALDNWNRHSE